MRRIALILTLIAAAAAAAMTTSATGDDSHTYYIELDNAFGLNSGSEVRVAGVTAGQISELLINSRKKAVAKVELSGPVAVLGTETICSSEPQSLIAEYFIDCAPKGDPIETTDESDAEHAENPDIPVEQTRQTVQNDLVLSALRLPFRERLTLLINEFGTALAGNPENLNEAIRRGAPALEQTRKVFDLLASQNTIIRDLNADSETIISKLAERRTRSLTSSSTPATRPRSRPRAATTSRRASRCSTTSSPSCGRRWPSSTRSRSRARRWPRTCAAPRRG